MEPVSRMRTATRDVDSASQVLTEVYDSPIRLHSAPPQGFRFSAEAIADASFGLVRLFCAGTGRTAVESFSSYLVAMSVGGGLAWRIGATEGQGRDPFLILPSRRVDADWSDMDLATLALDEEVVARAARARSGRDDALLPDAVDGPGSDSRYMRAVMGHLHATATQAPDLLDSPLVLEAMKQSAAHALLASYPLLSEPERLPVTGPRTVRQAVAFLDDHLGEPITIADAAVAAGISVRAMEAAFRRHLQQTPREYLRSARLAAARGELELADPARSTVAAIAARWGFAHAPRFARDYRAAFGEPPSVTLRR
jgi:AraC-like DNA-binding protein